MRSRTFLAISLGVLALALAYHVGARTAAAQGASSLVAMVATGSGVSDIGIFAVDATGRIYAGTGCYGQSTPFMQVGQIPGGSPPTAMTVHEGLDMVFVGCENGDVYRFFSYDYPAVSPAFCSNVVGGATPATQESFGSLKARYRGEREPQGVKRSTDR